MVIYPEGTTTKEPDLWPMRGKTGAARLALATGAPVIPVVMWGPQKIFDPRTSKISLRPRIPVTVVAGPPIDLSRWAGAAPTRATLDEMTDAIMLRLRDMLAEIRGGTPPPLWSPAAGPPATRPAGEDDVTPRRRPRRRFVGHRVRQGARRRRPRRHRLGPPRVRRRARSGIPAPTPTTCPARACRSGSPPPPTRARRSPAPSIVVLAVPSQTAAGQPRRLAGVPRARLAPWSP